MARPSGTCSICGTFGPLSYEHVPPEAAFNKSKITEIDPRRVLGAQTWDQFLSKTGKQNQRGAGAFTICEQCNNDTGSWYGSYYADWAYQGMTYLSKYEMMSGTPYYFEIATLPVLKQIICMFGSACGPAFFQKNIGLRKFVLDRYCNYLPKSLQIYCGLMKPSSRKSRQAGITGLIRTTDRGIHSYVFSEIAFPPYVYILNLKNDPIESDMANISFFSETTEKKKRWISIRMPVLSIDAPYPADYRDIEEIKLEYDAGRGK